MQFQSCHKTPSGKAIRLSVAFLFFILLNLSLIPHLHGREIQKNQFKGFWVVRHNLTSQHSIDQLIKFATKHGFNNLVVQVRGRGYAFYNSDIVPRSPEIQDDDLDPLGYLVSRADSARLQVHAWLNTYLIWSSRQLPPDDLHLLNRYPEWIDTALHTDFSLETYSAQSEGARPDMLFLAPTHPDVNAYLKRVVSEIAERYRVDGVHLDYIRYRDLISGYNPSGLDHFREEYQIDPVKITTSGDLPGRRSQALWDQYRRDRVTELVRGVKKACDSAGILLSAAVKPNLFNASNHYFQEWGRWLNDDLIDLAVPMNYTPEREEFQANIEEMSGQVPLRKVVMGIGVYNQNRFAASEKLIRIRHSDFRGYCLFSYDSFLQDPGYIEVVRQFVRMD